MVKGIIVILTKRIIISPPLLFSHTISEASLVVSIMFSSDSELEDVAVFKSPSSSLNGTDPHGRQRSPSNSFCLACLVKIWKGIRCQAEVREVIRTALVFRRCLTFFLMFILLMDSRYRRRDTYHWHHPSRLVFVSLDLLYMRC